MKILMHDYTGHAFTSQLGRTLGRRGHEVFYYSFGGFETPKGRVARAHDDPEGFRARELTISTRFDKENLLKRHQQQAEYARVAAQAVYEDRPDVVMSSNSPIEVQAALMKACRDTGARFVFWVQDIHAEAIERIFVKKNVLLGRLAGAWYRRKEARLLAQSDEVVVIAEAFRDVFASPRWGLDVSDMHVIENWANIADIPQLPRDNDWARANMPGERPRIVYSGTLARKHNPQLLVKLAQSLDADVYLFSQGAAPDQLRKQAAAEGISNLHVSPWVSVEDLPKMLAGADILFAVIERDAGVFSVPSKVLSYLAAARPILASIPADNLAAINITRERAGLVSDPADEAALMADAQRLLADPDLREQMGKNGRAYAQKAFDIDAIAAKFEGILGKASPRGRSEILNWA